MYFFLATVEIERLDDHGVESGSIASTHVPVCAKDEEEASKKAVVWRSKSGKAAENKHLVWECREPERNLVWKVTRCVRVSEDVFLLLSESVSVSGIDQ